MGAVYNRVLVSRRCADDSKILQDSYDKLDKQLGTLKAKSHRLYNSYDDGMITKELYASRSKSLSEEIADVEGKIKKLKKEMRQQKDEKDVTGNFLERFKKYETVTEIDRELLVELVDKIFIENMNVTPESGSNKVKKVMVVFKFEDEYNMLEQFINENTLVNF